MLTLDLSTAPATLAVVTVPSLSAAGNLTDIYSFLPSAETSIRPLYSASLLSDSSFLLSLLIYLTVASSPAVGLIISSSPAVIYGAFTKLLSERKSMEFAINTGNSAIRGNSVFLISKPKTISL